MNIDDAHSLARGFFTIGAYIRALELTENTISDHGDVESCSIHHELQGDIFFHLSGTQVNSEVKCLYLFASVAGYSASIALRNGLWSFRGYTRSLFQLGGNLGINTFYGKAAVKAKRGLSVRDRQGNFRQDLKNELQELLNLSVEKMDANVTGTAEIAMSNQMDSKKESPHIDPTVHLLKKFWITLDHRTKRDFLVVDIRELTDFAKSTYGSRVQAHFHHCVKILDRLRWRCWKCHICSQVSYSITDCKIHLLENHLLKFEPEVSCRPKYVDRDLAEMINSGDWKPIDTEKAVLMILDRNKRREEFVYSNGWCSDWPVAEDEEREKILKEFSEALKSSCGKENPTLSCFLWEWLIDYTEEHLELTGVPGRCLDKCSFFKTPQCICFLDQIQLERICKYFRQDVRASIVSKVVNKIWEDSQVRERIDLQGVLSYNLLLDKRLLSEGKLEIDKTETIKHYKSTQIYEYVVPKGDKIISWLFDCPKIDVSFVSQMAKGEHNSELWFAALRIVQFMERKKVRYYDKRQKMLAYGEKLREVEVICDREDSRKNSSQRRRYVTTLQVKCEDLVETEADDTKCFLNVVRDILEKEESPRFEVIRDTEIKGYIGKLSANIQDYDIKARVRRLRKSWKDKLGQLDAKLLISESTHQKLIEELPKLSALEYRLVVIPMVKMFLQDKLKKMMKTSSNSAAAGEHKKRRI